MTSHRLKTVRWEAFARAGGKLAWNFSIYDCASPLAVGRKQIRGRDDRAKARM
jgi:hypothetical protein